MQISVKINEFGLFYDHIFIMSSYRKKLLINLNALKAVNSDVVINV